ncbi:MAG: DUF2799 domain-containing protein [Parvularculaceae bacterium]
MRLKSTLSRAVLLLAPIALSACATGMSKKQCLYADWHAIGYEDGANGRAASALGPRRAACADKAGVVIDAGAWRAGREEGLDEFCRPAKGFDYGSRGGRYAGVCAGHGEELFVAAYSQGLALHGLLANADGARGALANAESDLSRIDKAIASHEAALVSPATPHPERVDHLAAIKNLHDERDKVRREIPRLRHEVDRAEADLEDFRLANADYLPGGY